MARVGERGGLVHFGLWRTSFCHLRKSFCQGAHIIFVAANHLARGPLLPIHAPAKTARLPP
jgi:hypothetical protein